MALSESHHKMLVEGSGLSEAIIAERGYYTEEDPKALMNLGFSRDQANTVPALVIPIWGVDGTVVSHQIRPDNPIVGENGKPRKYESLPEQSPKLDIPPCVRHLIDDPAIPLVVTEGSKKADAAAIRGMCCISLAGVWMWRGRNSKGGSVELAEWDRVAIKGRIIYIAFDSDVSQKPGVRQAMRAMALVLKRRGAKDVRPLAIPVTDDDKAGIDDYFARGGTPTALLGCVDYDLLSTTGIAVNNRSLPEITTDALDAIVEANFPPSVFVRAGELVRINADERGDIVKVQGLNEKSLRGILARVASWIRTSKDGTSNTFPPKDVVDDLISLGKWPEIPPVVAVTKAPVLSEKGTISMSPGYCPDSMFYVSGKNAWPDWEGDVRSAVDFILYDTLADFPFATPADLAHALALMLLPIMRPYIKGPTPLHLIDAPVQGTGKSLLARVCLIPTSGDQISATTGTKDEEEWRKKIASSLLEGRSYIFLDNLSRKVDSDTLAGVLTSTEWNDRSLGLMRNINVPVKCVWVATANNAELSRDILRRTVWIRLDANVERPEDRRGFKHEDIEEWVTDNKIKIVSALCCIVSHWVNQGMPGYTERTLGSFSLWARAIGGVLSSCGVQGFLGNITELRAAANTDETSWAEFYQRWYIHFGSEPVKAGDLLQEFEIDDSLAGLLGDKGQNSKVIKLGVLLKKRIGVVASGLRVEFASKGGRSHNLVILPAPGSLGDSLGETGDSSAVVEGNYHQQVLGSNLEGKVIVGDRSDSLTDPHACAHDAQAHAPAHTHTRDGGGKSYHQLSPQVQNYHPNGAQLSPSGPKHSPDGPELSPDGPEVII